MKITMVIIINFSIMLSLLGSGLANQFDENIVYLTKEILQTDDPNQKARYFVYRARQYKQSGNIESALDDYRTAISITESGWILEESGFALLNNGNFEEAYEISQNLKSHHPHLAKGALKMESKSAQALKEIALNENPPEIVFDTHAVKVRSRLDVKRERDAAMQRNRDAAMAAYAATMYHTKKSRSESRSRSDSEFHSSSGSGSHSSSGSGSHSSSGSNFGPCAGNCASEQGICISHCNGDGQCIGNCAAAHGRCISRCH